MSRKPKRPVWPEGSYPGRVPEPEPPKRAPRVTVDDAKQFADCLIIALKGSTFGVTKVDTIQMICHRSSWERQYAPGKFMAGQATIVNEFPTPEECHAVRENLMREVRAAEAALKRGK